MKPWHMGTHLRVLSESYPMNTNIGRVNPFMSGDFIHVCWIYDTFDNDLRINYKLVKIFEGWLLIPLEFSYQKKDKKE